MRDSTLTAPQGLSTGTPTFTWRFGSRVPSTGPLRPARAVCAPRPEAAGAGLVISPIKAPFSDLTVEALIADAFAFPSAEMIEAAAAMWPRARDTAVVQGWHPLPSKGVHDDRGVEVVAVGENRVNREGPRARVEIGPGLVRLAHRDEAKAERTRERIAEAEREQRAWELEQLRRPMALAEFRGKGSGKREQITAWSADSRARMIATICELDLAPIVSGSILPVMVTLTLPGDWLAVAPTAAAAAALFKAFDRAWSKKWGPLRCIWKREFQARRNAPRTLAGLDSGHAPHWHIWTVPPVVPGDEFKRWLSYTWTRILFGAERAREARSHGECVCSEACRSLSAGTGVDQAEGLRARDPKRLAVYFLKESLGGEGKAYQNDAPPEWAGQSVGRFWGYRGIEKAVVSVQVDTAIGVQLARTLRRWQRSKRVTRQVVVQRVELRTGRVYTRKSRVRARAFGSAGWVAANSGAGLAAQLGRWASQLAADHWETVDGYRSMAEDYGMTFELDADPVASWPIWAAHGPLKDGGGFPVPAI